MEHSAVTVGFTKAEDKVMKKLSGCMRACRRMRKQQLKVRNREVQKQLEEGEED